MLRLRLLFTLVVVGALSFGAAAQDKEGDEQKKGDARSSEKAGDEQEGGDPFGDLFGDSLGGEVDLKGLTKGVERGKGGGALAPKQVEIKDKATIKLERVFAAERIRMHKRRGCEPADRDRTRITEVTVYEMPAKTPPFSVCLTLEADAHRAMRISTTIVSSKNRRIGKSESTVDFRAKPIVDHIMEFPPLEVRREGQYYYQVDIDGRPAGKLPLFVVKRVD